MFDGRWRQGVDQGVKPVGTAMRRAGITADQLTAMGLVMAAATAVAIGTGHLRLGLALLLLAAVPDLLDGAVAKAAGTSSPRGAFFDSVADRVTDSLILGGIAWHLARTEGGLYPLLPFAVLATSTLISYERAKAESLGYSAKGGLMERAERIGAICFGLLVPVLLVPVLVVVLGLTTLTAVTRFVKVWKQASAALPVPPVRRWRNRRERAVPRGERRFARPEREWGPSARWRTRRAGEPRTERAWRGRSRVRP